MAYEIEKNIPEPPRRISSADKYPWAMMKVGDSFTVPTNGIDTEKTARRVYQAGRQRGLKHGEKYRVVVKDGGIRIWRIE